MEKVKSSKEIVGIKKWCDYYKEETIKLVSPFSPEFGFRPRMLFYWAL